MRSADSGTAVQAVIDLAVLTGAVGTAGAGIFPLDEKNNTQGMLDMGICPEFLPGYLTYANAAAKFGAAWNCSIPVTPGKDLFQIFEGIERGEIKALYVMGSDPLQVMPDRNRVLKALQKLDLLIVQDLFPTETVRLAHVVLPAATAAEKSGSFTTVDNRVQCFLRALAPSGPARTDADILTKLHRLVAPVTTITAPDAESVLNEIDALTGLYSGTCDHGACRIGRTKSRVEFGEKKAALRSLTPAALAESKGFTLSLGPVLYHNGTLTTRSENNLTVAPEAYVEICSADAAKAGIACGDTVTLVSALGSCTLKARISSDVQPGLLFAPAHFREPGLNQLISAGRTASVTLQKA